MGVVMSRSHADTASAAWFRPGDRVLGVRVLGLTFGGWGLRARVRVLDLGFRG